MKKGSGYIYFILAGLLWGTVGFFVRRLNAAGFSSMQVVAARSVVSFVIMLAIVLIRNPRAAVIRLRDIWMFIGTGIVSVAAFSWCYFSCMQETTLSVACILMYSSPVFAAILAALIFKERMDRRTLVALVMAFTGCVIVTGIWLDDLSVVSGVGILLGVLCGFFYALYSIFSRFALVRYDTFTINLYSYLLTAIATLPFARPAQMVSVVAADPKLLIYLLGVAVFTVILPYLLFTQGLKKVEIGLAYILTTVEILAVLFFSVVVFQEPFTWYNLIGSLLVVSAVILLSVKGKQKNAPDAPDAALLEKT